MKTTRYLIASSAVALLVSGCGGGSSSSASSGTTIPTAAIQITSTNATTVAKGSVSNSTGLAKSGSSGAGAVAVVVAGQPRVPVRGIVDVALSELNFVQSLSLPATPAVVTGAALAPFPATFGCGAFAGTSTLNGGTVNSTNGTMLMDVQGTNTAGLINISSITITYTNCVNPNPAAAGATTTTNGTMSLTINTSSGGVLNATTGKYVGAPAPNQKIQSVGMSFTGYSAKDTIGTTVNTLSMSGGISFGTSDDGTVLTATLTATNMSTSSTGATTDSSSMNGSIVVTQDSPSLLVPTGNYSFKMNSLQLASTTMNGSVTINTPVAFSGTGVNDPVAGTMVISGASNSSMTIQVIAPVAPATTSTGVNVKVNDGTTATQPVYDQNFTWAQL